MKKALICALTCLLCVNTFGMRVLDATDDVNVEETPIVETQTSTEPTQDAQGTGEENGPAEEVSGPIAEGSAEETPAPTGEETENNVTEQSAPAQDNTPTETTTPVEDVPASEPTKKEFKIYTLKDLIKAIVKEVNDKKNTGKQTPVQEEVPTEQTPAEQTPAEETPSEQTPAEEPEEETELTEQQIEEVANEVLTTLKANGEDELDLVGFGSPVTEDLDTEDDSLFSQTTGFSVAKYLGALPVKFDYDGQAKCPAPYVIPLYSPFISIDVVDTTIVSNGINPSVVDEAVEKGKYIANFEIEYTVNLASIALIGIEEYSVGFEIVDPDAEEKVLKIDYDTTLEYTGENQEPVVTFYDGETVLDDVEYEIYIFGEHSWLGEYKGYISLTDERYADYKLDTTAIDFEIVKAPLTFAGWVPEGSNSIKGFQGLDSQTFNWTIEDGKASMEYNGFSPLTYLTSTSEYAIPTASFVNSKNEPVTLYRGVGRDYVYLTTIDDYPWWAGDYTVNFVLDPLLPYYCVDAATFTIAPKEISLDFTKTIFDVADYNKEPKYNIISLVGLDKLINYKVKFDYFTTNEDGSKGYQLDGAPTEVGDYIASAQGIVYKIGDLEIPCPNYVFVEPFETVYQIVDNQTKRDVLAYNGTVHIGTINNSSAVNNVDLITPTSAELEELFGLETTPSVLLDALKDGKTVNLYVVAEDVANPENMILPIHKNLSNVALIDINLYASVDGDPTRYQITNTGEYIVNVDVAISPYDASRIGISTSRDTYIARYHNSVYSDSKKQVYPYFDGSNYIVTVTSNRFSEFCIYTVERVEEDVYEKIVPYTGE